MMLPLKNRFASGLLKYYQLVHLLESGGVIQATSLMNMFLEPLNKLQ